MSYHLSIDIETYSSVDIKKSGMYKYVQSPDFQIMLFAYSINGGTVDVIDLTRKNLPTWLVSALNDPTVIKHAYNAAFEWYSLNTLCPSPIQQWRCTQLHGLYCGYPAGLGAITSALGLDTSQQKMWQGNALIRTFCKPCEPSSKNGNRTRILPKHDPAKWELFKLYNKQDVVAEMAVEESLSMFPVPATEQHLWELDVLMNATGVKVDRQFVANIVEHYQTVTQQLIDEAVSLTGLYNPNSLDQLKEWLETETDMDIDNLQKDTVCSLLDNVDSEKAKRVLRIRQELGKSSIKKYDAMMAAMCNDDRVRGLLQFYGANRTGRWAGRLVQVQNLPQNHLKALDCARECVLNKQFNILKLTYGDLSTTFSQLVRTAFIPQHGKVLTVADFSAIEARVLAWLAGEQWRLNVFATHGKIYEASASAMFDVPIEKITKGNPEYELRQKGKVAELALGYGGGKGALISMGALNMGLSDDDLPEVIQRWRKANKRITDLWYALNNAAIECVKTGRSISVNGLLFALEGDVRVRLRFLTITLPSKRKLFYAQPFIGENHWGNACFKYYEKQNSAWAPADTYGGKLAENITQAIARDCLAESIKRLHSAGYNIVFHVHDEVVIEGESGLVDTVCDIMGEPIPWAEGLILKAAGFETAYYKKD